jgi:hypothetical protein
VSVPLDRIQEQELNNSGVQAAEGGFVRKIGTAREWRKVIQGQHALSFNYAYIYFPIFLEYPR